MHAASMQVVPMHAQSQSGSVRRSPDSRGLSLARALSCSLSILIFFPDLSTPGLGALSRSAQALGAISLFVQAFMRRHREVVCVAPRIRGVEERVRGLRGRREARGRRQVASPWWGVVGRGGIIAIPRRG